MLHISKKTTERIKNEIKNYSCDHIIWLIGILPKIGGFPLLSEKLFKPIWIVHLGLVTYIYMVGVPFYQFTAINVVGVIGSCFNILVAGVVYSESFWFLLKRKEINGILLTALENDALVINRGKFLNIYQNLMKRTKIILVFCFCFHFINEGLLFMPKRVFDMSSFYISNCVGLGQITRSPNREICMLLIFAQEATSLAVILSFDLILVFVYSHTTTVLLMLCRDVEDFYNTSIKFDGTPETLSEVRSTLKNFVHRHTQILLTVDKMQKLFSINIGATLVLNFIAVSTFFVMPLEAALSFAPLILLTLSVFFVYCLLGQRLFNASLEFEIAVYSCGWENLRPREQRVVYLMLRRAQDPVVLNAGGMIPIVLSTFATSVQAIYKFVTVFRV